MDEISFEDIEFVVGWCEACQRDVLTYDRPDANPEPRACVLCDGFVAGALRHASGRELDREGYALWEQAGCSRSGCGSGGCGSR